MSKLKNLCLFFVLFFVVGIATSCEKDDPVTSSNTEIDPFNNGTSERNLIVVISDIHLGPNLAFAECNKNLATLEKFVNQINESKNVKELIIAGDMFDEWFVPASSDTYQGKDQKDYMQRIAATNKGVFDAFNKIIQAGNVLVTYVPGNHDLTITKENVELVLPGINQARDEVQGLGTYSPASLPVLAVEHGHRYNIFCAPDPISNKDLIPGSILPPGYFLTRLAVQHVVQHCTTPREPLPVVTPNANGGQSQYLAYYYWNMWQDWMTQFPVDNMLDEKIIVTNIGGFTGNYSINDFIPFQTTPGGFIDMKLYKGIQDTWKERQAINKVAVEIPTDQAFAKSNSSSETDNQAVNQYFMNAFSNKKIVVFGHSHDAKIVASNNYKGEKCVYINSGTWIDHNNVGPTTMDFVVITPQSADQKSETTIKLMNYKGGTINLFAQDSFRY